MESVNSVVITLVNIFVCFMFLFNIVIYLHWLFYKLVRYSNLFRPHRCHDFSTVFNVCCHDIHLLLKNATIVCFSFLFFYF